MENGIYAKSKEEINKRNLSQPKYKELIIKGFKYTYK